MKLSWVDDRFRKPTENDDLLVDYYDRMVICLTNHKGKIFKVPTTGNLPYVNLYDIYHGYSINDLLAIGLRPHITAVDITNHQQFFNTCNYHFIVSDEIPSICYVHVTLKSDMTFECSDLFKKNDSSKLFPSRYIYKVITS